MLDTPTYYFSFLFTVYALLPIRKLKSGMRAAISEQRKVATYAGRMGTA
jgi:hypothetical protein